MDLSIDLTIAAIFLRMMLECSFCNVIAIFCFHSVRKAAGLQSTTDGTSRDACVHCWGGCGDTCESKANDQARDKIR
eukprot:m.159835 g.159835  ORF g.159835 m.159835 type:complete len:77 (+) comp38767_c0_seq49:5723-5953(+)